MDKWRTYIELERSDNSISHEDSSIFLGSCFSENIADKLKYFGLKAQNNPLGIVYNPASILKQLSLLLNEEQLDEARFIERQQVFFHLDAHSDFHAFSKDELLRLWESKKTVFQNFWAKANFLFITLGTAWVYEHQDTREIVANCHKLPSNTFTKKILSVSEIKGILSKIVEMANQARLPKQVIFTVSPVRHIKDGIVNNSLSKSHLLTAIHEVKSSSNIQYFPAFEIMMDDLRDYRFYADDMLHPSSKAVDYIWRIFQQSYFHPNTIELGNEIYKIRLMRAHRPFHEESDEHQTFLHNLDKKIEAFYKKNPKLTDVIF